MGTGGRFLGHLALQGRMQPESAQRYLTAINAVHRSVLLTPVGPAARLGPWCCHCQLQALLRLSWLTG